MPPRVRPEAAAARFRILAQASRAGLGYTQAARSIGISHGGLQSFLDRWLGEWSWPVEPGELLAMADGIEAGAVQSARPDLSMVTSAMGPDEIRRRREEVERARREHELRWLRAENRSLGHRARRLRPLSEMPV